MYAFDNIAGSAALIGKQVVAIVGVTNVKNVGTLKHVKNAVASTVKLVTKNQCVNVVTVNTGYVDGKPVSGISRNARCSYVSIVNVSLAYLRRSVTGVVQSSPGSNYLNRAALNRFVEFCIEIA